ncbi:extracellular solute-binding protein [Variovorax robiniae]|uniref:Extracellular solute-binding protein n=1 Tax=Variovorax robiniae TaxID=1836199 RepID=A0ABU8XGG9_9BURK
MTTEYSRRQITKLLGSAAAGLAMPALSMAQARKRQFEGRTVNLLAVQFGHHQHLWNLIPEFEKETGIKVNLEYAPFDQTREKTLLDMSSKTGRFDLFTIDIMWLAEYAAAGYLEPLSKYLKNKDLTADDYDIDDFVPRVFSGTGIYNNTLYNIAFDSGTVGHEFRRDWMEKANLPVPKRFDGKFTHTAFMETVGALNEASKGVAGYVTQPQRWFWGWTFTPLMYAFQKPANVGNEFVDKDWNVTIASDDNLAALKYYLGWRKFTPKNDANFGYGEVVSLYQQGKAAGGIHYLGFIGEQFEGTSPVAGKNVYLHTPVGPHGRTDPFFGSWGLGVSADSKQKEAAWVFLQWITHKNQLIRASEKGAGLVRHSQFKSPTVAKAQPWVVDCYEFLLKTANPDERIRVPEWAQISEVMGLYGNKAWLNEMTPEQALEAMAKEMKDAFRKGGYYRSNAKNPPQLWRNLSYYDKKPSGWI